MSGIGYGEVEEWMYETPNPLIFYVLLEAKINYIVDDPGNFLDVVFDYGPGRNSLRGFYHCSRILPQCHYSYLWLPIPRTYTFLPIAS